MLSKQLDNLVRCLSDGTSTFGGSTELFNHDLVSCQHCIDNHSLIWTYLVEELGITLDKVFLKSCAPV